MDAYVGLIMLWAGRYVPESWLPCCGQTLQIMQYQALYAVIGTQFGGNGQTTFMLPDLRSRVPVGTGSFASPDSPANAPGLSTYTMGQVGGLETVTLTTDQMPAHVHPFSGTATGSINSLQLTASLPASAQTGNSDTPGNGNVPAKAPDFLSHSLPELTIYGPKDNTTTLPVEVSVAAGQNLNLNLTNGQTASAGGNLPHENRQPYIGLNYIICVNGLFPPQP